MRQALARIVDSLIPDDIKEFEQAEELERARILMFILLIHLVAAAVSLIVSAIYANFSPTNLHTKIIWAMVLGTCGYTLSIWSFWRTGQHVISGNIYACTYFAAIFIGTGMLAASQQELIGGLLYLLVLPLLVSFMADYISGIVWLIMVALAPIVLNSLLHTHLGEFFLSNWVVLCLCLFVAIYISHRYLKYLSRRLNNQCTTFEFAAAHDPLTGIPNRAAFESRLSESIKQCKLNGTKAVLVYIDLDNFKPINDNYGHQAGDIVLVTIADRLLHLIRRTDTVARLGGDEFALIFDQCSPEGIKPLIERMNNIVSEPIDITGKQVNVSCSIGVVVCPDDGVDSAQLSKQADERMYEAKRKAKADWAQTPRASIPNK